MTNNDMDSTMSSTAQDWPGRLWGNLRQINIVMLLATMGLMAIGVTFVKSACAIRASDSLKLLYVSHAQMAVAGIVIYLVLANINYHWLVRWSLIFYAGSLVLLMAVLVIGTAQMGARRWVFGIQPSEIAKLAVVMQVAWFLGRREVSRGVSTYLITLGMLAAPAILVLKQPDLGTTMIFVPTVFAMLFVADIAPRTFWTVIAVGVLAVVWIVGVVVMAENSKLSPDTENLLRRTTGLARYQQDRIAHFIYPERDTHGGAWNKHQSEIAVGSGCVWGKGLRKGDQNLLGYLPSCVSANDFIFSVLAEEAGFVGTLVVLMLYALVIGAILVVAVCCPDGVGKMLCVGVATMMFCHVFVNIAMTIGLLPITGLPLPFISYGRTSMLTMMAALGLVQSVAIHGRQSATYF